MAKAFPDRHYGETIQEFYESRISHITGIFEKANIPLPNKGFFESYNRYLSRIRDLYDTTMQKNGKFKYKYQRLAKDFNSGSMVEELWQTPEESEKYLEERKRTGDNWSIVKDTSGGYRRKRMTKKRRNRKTKRSRK